VRPMSKHVTVAVVGAGMAGQAHAFGYRNATMHPGRRCLSNTADGSRGVVLPVPRL